MQSLRLPALAIIPLLFLMSCDEDVSYDAPQAVIEGYISQGGYPTVLFSSTIVPGKGGELKDALINWGKVTISDGEREVVLTGSPDKNYLPPFRYHTLDMVGECGKTYTIHAKFNELEAWASCSIPYPTEIDEITLSRTDIDTLWSSTLTFTSPSDVPSFYYVSMRKLERNTHHSPAMISTLRADLPNHKYSIPLLRPRIKTDSTDYISQFISGEEWEISLNRVEEQVYTFWKAYNNMILFGNSPFLSSSESLPSNIMGGYGVWSPQASSTSKIKIE